MGFDTPSGIDQSSDVDHQQTANRTHDGDAITPSSVSTDEADITNETLVLAELGSSVSISADTPTTVPFDNEIKDERGEFDTSTGQFNPDQTGWYRVSASLVPDIATDGDRVNMALYDDDADSEIRRFAGQTSPTTTTGKLISGWVPAELTAGTNYVIKYENADSSDSLPGFKPAEWMFVRPLYRKT